MSVIFRFLYRSVCCFSVMASSSVFAQGDPLIAARVKPHLAAYADCAKRHLEQEAKKEPTTTFERVESSLRPACGREIDLAREALFRGNFSRGEANSMLRSAYASLQPELRSLFDQAAASERKRLQSEKDHALRPTHGEEGGSAPQDQIKAVEAERSRLLQEASSVFDACLASELKSLVPSSNEPAETLTKVIEIKCGDAEKKLASLGFAFYGASRDDLQRIVKEPLEERKRRVVAEIVTLRAELSKEAAKPAKPPEAGPESKTITGN